VSATAVQARRPAGRGGVSGLAGAGTLAKLAFRRDRAMIPVWVYVLTALVAGTAYTWRHLFKTAAAREHFAATATANSAFDFLYGHLYSNSIGGLTAWRYGVYAGLGAALMSMFLVIRHTRADEETGRLELIGSAPVGRHAALTVGLTVAAVANLAVAGLMGIALVFLKLPGAGSFALSCGVASCGLVFAGIAACAAQVSSTARGARGLTIAVLVVAYFLQALGNGAGAKGPSWLVWLSPLGWASKVRPFAGERWPVLLLSVGFALLCAAAAFGLAGRRDVGAGLLPDRAGSAQAGRTLSSPLGLAWRIQRGTMAAWAAGFFFGGAASGAAGKGIGSLLKSSHPIKESIVRIGGHTQIVNAYLAALLTLFGLVAAAYAVSAMLRLRSEETDGRADPLLAGPVSRARWWASHLLVAAGGTVVMLVVGGLGLGLGYGLRAGSAGHEVGMLVAASLAQLPAALVVVAVLLVIIGIVPAWSVPGGWTVLAIAVLVALFGEGLRLSHWIQDISPFTHVPKVPGVQVTATPLVWMCGLAFVLAAIGLAGLRRRDIG
jgi:polyether ionophore transport system permease protein